MKLSDHSVLTYCFPLLEVRIFILCQTFVLLSTINKKIAKAFIAGILCVSILISSGGTALTAESSERYDAADLSKPYRTEEFSAEETYAQDSYREGEAIAIVRGLEKPQVAGVIERLAEVSPDSLQAVTEEWQASGNEMEVKQDRMQGMDTFTVWGITDHDNIDNVAVGDADAFTGAYLLITRPLIRSRRTEMESSM